jgi:hypothetical protein
MLQITMEQIETQLEQHLHVTLRYLKFLVEISIHFARDKVKL